MATTSKRKTEVDVSEQVRELARIVRRMMEAQQNNRAISRDELRELWARLEAIEQD